MGCGGGREGGGPGGARDGGGPGGGCLEGGCRDTGGGGFRGALLRGTLSCRGSFGGGL